MTLGIQSWGPYIRSMYECKDLNVYMCAVHMDRDTLNLALLQYSFTSGKHEMKVALHGSLRSGGSYIQTMPVEQIHN